MSGDSYYLIRKHPDGGFTAVMHFVSDETGYPEAKPEHPQFENVLDAMQYADDQDTEHGPRLDHEVFEEIFQVGRVGKTAPPDSED